MISTVAGYEYIFLIEEISVGSHVYELVDHSSYCPTCVMPNLMKNLTSSFVSAVSDLTVWIAPR
jgi:hypothetical protein